MKFEFSKEYFDRLRDAIQESNHAFVTQSMQEVNPADISSLLYEFNTEEAKYVIDHLDREVGAEIISYIEEDTRSRFLHNYEPEEVAKFIDYIDSDDAADILNDLPVKFKDKVILHMENQEKASYILELMRYDEDCAGGLMAKELIKANLNWTIVQCIEEIRRQAENVEKIFTVYVVDNRGKLLGRVSLKRIILADDKARIADIYEPDIVSVETSLEEQEVADIIQKYDLEVVPVVNVQGKLVGRITVDDILDVITEMAEQERNMMAGISEEIEEDDSVWVLTRARLPWLIVGMIGGIFAAKFIGIFEDNPLLIPAMAFIPLIMATSGNVGIQSSTIMVQTLATRSFFYGSYARRIFKVVIVALLNAIILSGLVLVVNLFTDVNNSLSFIVSLALFSVVVLASFTGTATPLLLDRIGINPAFATGPIITTFNDLLGLSVYFGIAQYFQASGWI